MERSGRQIFRPGHRQAEGTGALWHLVYIVADHGFDKDKKTHLYAPFVLAGTNDSMVVRSVGTREDIAPTILKKFGLDLSKIEPKLDGCPFDMQATTRKATPELTKEFRHKYNYIYNKENNAKKVTIRLSIATSIPCG
jgi:hypothetical protein